MIETRIHNGILLRLKPQPLPEALAAPIRERWQTDEEDDTVSTLLAKAAAITDAGAFLRPAHIGSPDGDVICLDGHNTYCNISFRSLDSCNIISTI